MPVNFQERLRSALGGALGIGFTAFISLYISHALHLSPWLVAPLGASAVLVYAVPSSPLAQPWSVIGGNTVSAIAGLLICNAVPDPTLAASLAVGLAIGAMFTLRCVHPPGGAMALLVVLTHTTAPVFALFPALTNSCLLVAFGLVYNNLTRRSYPHAVLSAATSGSGLLRVTEADLASALAQHNEVLDIDREELGQLLQLTEMFAYRRMAGTLTCKDLMTPQPVTVVFGASLKEAWALLQSRDIKALPVVDRANRVLGLLTPDHFLHHAAAMNPTDPADGLKRLITPTPTSHSDKPETAGQIMSAEFTTAFADEPADHLMALFSKGDRRHVLVLDRTNRLTGIISTSDIMRTLYHANAA